MLFDEKIEAIVIFLLCLSTAFPISNAAIGITVWIGIVLLLYYAYKGEKVSLANIHSVLLISMACFSFGTLIASLVISDKNSLELCWKQVRWLAYFIVAYLVAKKCKNNLAVMPALLVAVL